MDFPDNESQASVFTDWSAEIENLEWEDDEPQQKQTFLCHLLSEDLIEYPKLTFQTWLDLLDSNDASIQKSLKSLQWMDEMSYATTESLWNDITREIQQFFVSRQ